MPNLAGNLTFPSRNMSAETTADAQDTRGGGRELSPETGGRGRGGANQAGHGRPHRHRTCTNDLNKSRARSRRRNVGIVRGGTGTERGGRALEGGEGGVPLVEPWNRERAAALGCATSQIQFGGRPLLSVFFRALLEKYHVSLDTFVLPIF